MALGWQTAKVDTAAAGATAIVAAVSGYKIVVHQYTLVAAGSVTAKWQSASTDLTGAMSLAGAGYGVAVAGGSGENPAPLVQTAVGEALNLNLGGAVQVSGHITYRLV